MCPAPKNMLLLAVASNEQYAGRLCSLLNSVRGIGKRVCYVCLSRPYRDVQDDLRRENIDTADFFFIDALSSHYEMPGHRRNCIFLKSPNLAEIMPAVRMLVKKERCRILLVDSVSAMLMYQESFQIISFTHSLTSEKWAGGIRKVFMALKQGVLEKENNALINDLKMFADKIVELC